MEKVFGTLESGSPEAIGTQNEKSYAYPQMLYYVDIFYQLVPTVLDSYSSDNPIFRTIQRV